MLGRIPYATSHAENKNIALRSLQQVDMQSAAPRFYSELSGGEQQRVQIARVLTQLVVPDDSLPRYLLLDEPTSALDLAHQYLLLNLLRQLSQKNIGILISLHDLNLAMQYADRVLVLQQGKQVANGYPAQVLTPECIQEVFDLPVTLVPHPRYNDKHIIVPL